MRVPLANAHTYCTASRDLRKSQAELSSLNLKSSATLGTGRMNSHKEILDRQEDKEVRRISKRANLDPMIDEDSGDEEYPHSPLPNLTIQPRPIPEEQERRSRPPDIRSSLGDTQAASVTTVPTSVGSALRRNADGSVAAPKSLPKRNKGSKVNQTIYYLIIG